MRTSLVTLFLWIAFNCFGQVGEQNDPARHPGQLNRWFVDSINNKPVNFYLNHDEIDKYSKLFYRGQFAASDDDLTFAFLDSVLTTNTVKRDFYVYVLNSVLKLADGALAEVVGSYCRSFLEIYPCEFIELKTNKLYSDNYDVWIYFASEEYYFDNDPVSSVNSAINSMKVIMEKNCFSEKNELDIIQIQLLARIKELEDEN
jgi:hypothetical protein